MQIVCPACGKRLQVAEDKLPSTERVMRIACPACHERFQFDPRNGSETRAIHGFNSPTLSLPPLDNTAEMPTSPSPPTLHIEIAETGPPPRALVCLNTPAHRDECARMLPALGFSTVHVIENQVRTLMQLTQVSYECVILDTTFDGSTPEANPILACVAELPMTQRRHMFVALCTPGMDASDMIAAYSQSVNYIISYADILTCHRALEQHLTEHKRQYRTYWELCQELGRE